MACMVFRAPGFGELGLAPGLPSRPKSLYPRHLHLENLLTPSFLYPKLRLEGGGLKP